ncbi:MAG: rhodanese-like domain-containing protein [Burkholderiaceae bacterium]|nr:rhodanese-like domain-containing protein [Burkholderiaceae bacterium]MBV8440101.1 rhodanese-like domain-containing protein [Hyphomicrobiales bacterium]
MQFVLENWPLVAMACISGALLLWPLVRGGAGGSTVTTLAATQLINSRHAQVVDVRAPDQFAAGSVPNARNIPVAEIGKRCNELRKDRPVIVVSDQGRGTHSAVAGLKAGGISEVYVLSGGVGAWREAGLPLKK